MTYRRAQKTKAGTPADADFQVAATDGLLAVDTTNKLLYYRAGGTWQAPGGGIWATPPDWVARGIVSEPFPAAFASGASALTSGTIYGCLCPVAAGVTVTGVTCSVSVAGAGATPSLLKVGIYPGSGGSGSPLAQSADQSANALWTVVQNVKIPFSAPYGPTSSAVALYAVILSVGAFATPLQLTRGSTPILTATRSNVPGVRAMISASGQTDLVAFAYQDGIASFWLGLY
jgi:hypothetical protein